MNVPLDMTNAVQRSWSGTLMLENGSPEGQTRLK